MQSWHHGCEHSHPLPERPCVHRLHTHSVMPLLSWCCRAGSAGHLVNCCAWEVVGFPVIDWEHLSVRDATESSIEIPWARLFVVAIWPLLTLTPRFLAHKRFIPIIGSAGQSNSGPGAHELRAWHSWPEGLSTNLHRKAQCDLRPPRHATDTQCSHPQDDYNCYLSQCLAKDKAYHWLANLSYSGILKKSKDCPNLGWGKLISGVQKLAGVSAFHFDSLIRSRWFASWKSLVFGSPGLDRLWDRPTNILPSALTDNVLATWRGN